MKLSLSCLTAHQSSSKIHENTALHAGLIEQSTLLYERSLRALSWKPVRGVDDNRFFQLKGQERYL